MLCTSIYTGTYTCSKQEELSRVFSDLPSDFFSISSVFDIILIVILVYTNLIHIT